MNPADYAFAVGHVRANEGRLLRESELNGVLTARSYPEAVKRLKDRGWEIGEGDPAGAIEKRVREAWAMLSSVLPDAHAMDAVLIRNDFRNLKLCLKALIAEKEPAGLYAFPSVYDPEEIRAAVFARQNDKLPEPLRHADRSAYNILSKTRFAQLADAVIDRAALEWSLRLAKESNDPTLLSLCEAEAALTDVRTVLRCLAAEKAESFMLRAVSDCAAFTKQQLVSAAQNTEALCGFLRGTPLAEAVPAVKAGSAAFEKYCDDAVTSLLAPGKSEILGISPLLGYWYAVKTEALNLRIILSGKQTGQSDETIRERMRKTYV